MFSFPVELEVFGSSERAANIDDDTKYLTLLLL